MHHSISIWNLNGCSLPLQTSKGAIIYMQALQILIWKLILIFL